MLEEGHGRLGHTSSGHEQHPSQPKTPHHHQAPQNTGRPGRFHVQHAYLLIEIMGRRDKRFFNKKRGQKSIDQKSAIRYGIFMRRKKWWILLVTLMVVAGLGWWQRTRLSSWYYVRQLARADKESREAWIKRVADLDQAVLPS